jgi:spore germination protein YaaH
VLGYYAGDLPVVYHSVTAFSKYLSAVSVARYSVDAAGVITGTLSNTGLLPFNRAHGIHNYICVGNFGAGGDFDAAIGHSAIVTNKDAVTTNLTVLARNGGYEGVNLDFEAIKPPDRGAYGKFVIDLAARLHAEGLKLILSVPAETKDDPADDWAGAFDYKLIGQYADLLQLMTYDQHGPAWSGPGPVAGADWLEDCVKYAVSVVSPAKLLIGLPAYGYDWDLTAHAVTGAYPLSYVAWSKFGDWLSVPGAVQRWDDTALSPSVKYTLDGHDHEAWFENTASIKAKTAVVKKYSLAGLSVWALGQEDLSYWKAAMAGL